MCKTCEDPNKDGESYHKLALKEAGCHLFDTKRFSQEQPHLNAATGRVSYSVGGAALASATPTLWLATPIFDGFCSFSASK